MILAPRYSSSEPPPASGPVRSKTTPILIFFSWAWAETAIPNTATAAISPPSRRAALRTGIKTSPEELCLGFFLVLLTPITRGAPADVKRLAPRTRRQQVVNPGAGCADPSGKRASEKSVNLLAVKLQAVDDLVDHLALRAHGQPHQIEFAADHGLHHLAVGGVVRGREHVLGIDRGLDVARQRPLQRAGKLRPVGAVDQDRLADQRQILGAGAVLIGLAAAWRERGREGARA